MNRDMGPVGRLVGPDLPKPQEWQHALPKPPQKLANMKVVERDIEALIKEHSDKTSTFVRLALNSANTYRHTDYQVRFRLLLVCRSQWRADGALRLIKHSIGRREWCSHTPCATKSVER